MLNWNFFQRPHPKIFIIHIIYSAFQEFKKWINSESLEFKTTSYNPTKNEAICNSSRTEELMFLWKKIIASNWNKKMNSIHSKEIFQTTHKFWSESFTFYAKLYEDRRFLQLFYHIKWQNGFVLPRNQKLLEGIIHC